MSGSAQREKDAGTCVPAPPAPRPLGRRDFWLGFGLLLAIVAMYQPTWYAGFIWDDDAHLTAHPSIVGPLGLKEVWTTRAANYFPLVLTTFWAVNKMVGLDPLVFHLLGVGLHIGCTLLLWLVLRRLRIPGAWLGAALWGLHPVQVESVAWVSEIINTQSGVFFLLSIWFAARWLAPAAHARPAGRDYGWALVCAAGAMLSKPSTVMLPVVLALTCWWLRGRLQWRDARWLAPFFLFAFATSAWAIWEQRVQHRAVGGEWGQSLAERFIIAGRAVWFYAAKLFWPHPLSFIYPRWTLESGRFVAWLPALGAAVAVGTLGWLGWRRGWRGPLFAVAYHVALLFPVLGFFNVYFFRYSFVADHFQYLASMGLLALSGAVVATGHGRFAPRARGARIIAVGTAGVLITFSGLGWRHARNFVGEEALWRATLKTNPTSVLAHNNLGVFLVEKGQLSAALAHYDHALAVNPRLADTHYNKGRALALLPDRLPEAMQHFQTAIESRPDFTEARLSLANALASFPARRGEAIAQYEALLQLKPNHANAHSNLGVLLSEWPDRLADAIRHGETAVRLKADLPEAHFNLANTLARLPERAEDAIRHYQAALTLKPDYLKVHINLGLAYARSRERLPDALRHYEAALALEPRSAVTHNNLAVALAQSGRTEEARKHFERALELAPDYGDARNNLARLPPPAP